MPNIGLPELIIVLVIALVVFGPKRLPQMGRQLGQALREFKSATAEVRAQVGVDEIADSVKDIKSGFSLTGPDAAAPAAVEAGAPSAPEAATATNEPAGTAAPDMTEPMAAPTAPAPVSAPTSPAIADPPPEVAGPAGDGGIESFGKLKRGSASAARPSAD